MFGLIFDCIRLCVDCPVRNKIAVFPLALLAKFIGSLMSIKYDPLLFLLILSLLLKDLTFTFHLSTQQQA